MRPLFRLVTQNAVSIGAFATATLIAIVDPFVRPNISTLYYLPLAVLISLSPRANHRLLAALCSLFVITEAFVKRVIIGYEPRYLQSSLINRSFIVMGMWAMVLLLPRLNVRRAAALQAYSTRATLGDADEPFNQLVHSVAPLAATILALLIISLIAAIDVPSPAYVNPATLYSIPLLLIAWTANRRLAWAATALMVVLVGVGFLASPGDASPTVLRSAAIGRVISIFVLITLNFAFHHETIDRRAPDDSGDEAMRPSPRPKLG